MASLSGFDASNVTPMASFAPLPNGRYVAAVTNSEFKPTKNGTGEYLELTFEVLEGEHKGRKLWARLNLKNASAEAVRIAEQELSAICHATGVMRPNDSLELHDIPLLLDVKVTKRNDTGDLTNEIKGYKRRGHEDQRPQANGSTPPWGRSQAV
jgi:hypothetical protein